MSDGGLARKCYRDHMVQPAQRGRPIPVEHTAGLELMLFVGPTPLPSACVVAANPVNPTDLVFLMCRRSFSDIKIVP